MAGTRPEGLAQGGMWATSQPWQTSSERAPSSRSNLPCGQQRRYRRREAGDVGHPGTPGPSALASLQGSSRSPDNSTLDVQLGDRQAEPALSPSGPELAACT